MNFREKVRNYIIMKKKEYFSKDLTKKEFKCKTEIKMREIYKKKRERNKEWQLR